MPQYQDEIKKSIKKLIDGGNFLEASELIQQCQGLVIEDVELYSMKAVIAILNNRFADAETILLKGLSIDEDNFDILYNLGYLYEVQEKKQKAYDAYLKLSKYENIDEYHNLVLEALQRLQEVAVAETKKVGPKQKIIFFVRQGMDSFLGDIIMGLSDEYEVRKKNITNLQQIDEGMQWADVCWFEWCDDLIAYGSKVKLAKDKKIICRLHRYEAFSEYVNNVKWENIDEVIFVSQHICDVVRRKVKLPIEKCQIIYNGIDFEEFKFTNRKKGYNLAWIGYLNLRKNPMLIIQYLNELVKIDKRYQLHIAGSFQDEALSYYMQDIIKKMNLQNNVYFSGFIPNEQMSNWLKDKHYIVTGSIAEGHPVGVMEAMASGLKPAIHYFPGADSFYPENYIYYNLDDFKRIIIEDEFNSQEASDYIKKMYPFSKQLNKITMLIKTLLKDNNIHRKNPLVTIGITNYNAEKYVDECIKSILNQTYKNLEIIIIDDQSTDKSVIKLNKYAKKHKNIKVIQHIPNSGSPDLGRLEIIEQAKGEYFMLFDSDDFFADRMAVEKLVQVVVQDDNIDYAYCSLRIVNEQSDTINQWDFEQYSADQVVRETFRRGGSGILTTKGLFRTEFFRENDISYLSNGTAGDTLTALLCMKKGMKIKYLGEPLIAYRQHQSNFTFDVKKRIDSIVNILEYIVNNFTEKIYFSEHTWDIKSNETYQANKYYLITQLYYNVFKQYYSGQWKPWENDDQKKDEAEVVKEYLIPLRDLLLAYSQKVSNITDCYNKDIDIMRVDLNDIYNMSATTLLVNSTIDTNEENTSLKFLLRRVEHVIEPEESFKQIIELLINQTVTISVLIELAKKCVIQPDQVLNDIGIYLYGKQYAEDALELLSCAYTINEKNQEVLFNIGYIVHELGDTKTAVLYLGKLEKPNEYAIKILRESEE